MGQIQDWNVPKMKLFQFILQVSHRRPTPIDDNYNLQRFVDAQNRVYEQVCRELKTGQKRGHWMWYIFPQIEGLGRSSTARRYAISTQQEASAYLEHPVLGSRLRDCTQLVVHIDGRTIEQIFYFPDHLKFHSSMTLFMASTTDNTIFTGALDKYFDGNPDQATLDRLRAS